MTRLDPTGIVRFQAIFDRRAPVARAAKSGRSPPKADRGYAEQMPTLGMYGSAQTGVIPARHPDGR